MDYQRLIIRHLSGETTQEEEERLQIWIDQSLKHQKEYQSLKEAWEVGGKADKLPDKEKLYQRVEIKLNTNTHTFWQGRQHLRMAAVVSFILMLAGGYFFWNTNTEFYPNEWQLVTTLKGEKQRVILPDGSTVWLNTESSIQFPKQFKEGKRVVKLEGEAFFDVKRDTLHPFMIELAEGSIRVLGTSFSVKAYEADNMVETFVKSGMVQFNSPIAKHTSTIIEPQQKLSYSRHDKTIVKEVTKDANSLAWMENKIVFEANSLDEIAKELERYFDIEIAFEYEQLKECSMTGTFEKDSYHEILNTLAMTNTFKYREEEKKILIYGKGCQ